MQEHCIDLLKALINNGNKVLLETGGAITIEKIPKEVTIILDIKCPSSNMAEKNLWSNIKLLKKFDQVKFVIGLTDRVKICISSEYVFPSTVISKEISRNSPGSIPVKSYILSDMSYVFEPSIIFMIASEFSQKIVTFSKFVPELLDRFI